MLEGARAGCGSRAEADLLTYSLAQLLEEREDAPAAVALLEECRGRVTDELDLDDWSVDDRIERLRQKLAGEDRPRSDEVASGFAEP